MASYILSLIFVLLLVPSGNGYLDYSLLRHLEGAVHDDASQRAHLLSDQELAHLRRLGLATAMGDVGRGVGNVFGHVVGGVTGGIVNGAVGLVGGTAHGVVDGLVDNKGRMKRCTKNGVVAYRNFCRTFSKASLGVVAPPPVGVLAHQVCRQSCMVEVERRCAWKSCREFGQKWVSPEVCRGAMAYCR